MNKKLGAWAASSSNPEDISNRVKGIVLALSSVIILVAAQIFQVQLTANDVVSLASSLGALAGAIWAIWGAGIALVRWIAQVRD